MQRDEDSHSTSGGHSNVLEQEIGLASQAFDEFSKSNYEQSVNLLSKLLTLKGSDKKIFLNMAVAEYYKSGQTKVNQLQTSLQDIVKKIQMENSNSAADFAEHCVIYYNLAVTYYNTKQYSQAVQCFKQLESLGENMDETLLMKIIYLLVDAYLSSFKPYKAFEVIEFFESSDKLNKANKQTLIMKQYKMKCHLMMRSLDGFSKEIKHLGDATKLQSKEGIFLKSQFEMLLRRYSQSVKTLSSHQGNDTRNKYYLMCCANNIAVNYFEMKKYNLAHKYLVKAVEHKNALTELQKKNGPSSENLSNNRHYELLYNMGVTLLQCNKPLLAFDCLLGVIQSLERDSYSEKTSVINCFVGSSTHKKAILGQGVNCKNFNNSKDSSAMPMPTMGFASLCLENALLCLNSTNSNVDKSKMKKKKKEDDVMDADGSDVDYLPDDLAAESIGSNELFIAMAPSSPVKINEINNLRCSILTLKCYIALHHKNYLIALRVSNLLLQQPNLSGIHRYLALMYKAEALVGLDRLPESTDLMLTDISDINIFSSSDAAYIQRRDDENINKCEQNTEKLQNVNWFPHTKEGAQCIMHYNVAVVSVINGDLVKARTFLQKSLQHLKQPYPTQVYYLMIYLEVAEAKGKSKDPPNIRSIVA
ncbi:hypothetical protein HELRODRAFT_188650 [Helobdella robusta]|uniref:CCR4-NOT transcription complex subunit 10 n=1 Tax=Helobdella robusta TaxID=6412 RepID=T1FQ80_HELRO|nr:hypothetical protein HELRODRAFT_188650 [Helobdella robusta]ESO02285.1 hypothetical protein HELRODRAFT_188650 [Helobdella robusta]